jgi:hypothetical protein
VGKRVRERGKRKKKQGNEKEMRPMPGNGDDGQTHFDGREGVE